MRNLAVIRFMANAVGVLSIWLGAALTCAWFGRSNDILVESIGFALVLSALALAAWHAGSGLGMADLSASGWLGVFLAGALFTLIFAEIDCGWALKVVAGKPFCEHFNPGGPAIAFDMAAVSLTLITVPSALRAWLLKELGAFSGS